METKNIDNIVAEKETLLKTLRVFIDDENSISNYKTFQDLRQQWYDIGNIKSAENTKLNSSFNSLLKIYYNNRNRVYHSLKNLDKKKKLELCELLESYLEFDSDRIDEWNLKTNDIKDLEREWKLLSFDSFSDDERRDVNKRFWKAYKGFFKLKKNFFKRLDESRQINYDIKEEIISTVDEIKDNTEWLKTSKEIQTLQSKWKEVGEVPKKTREEQYLRFKESCDYFFEQYRLSKKENSSHKKVIKIQTKIKNWKNNLEFLGNSKNAEKIKEEYEAKILEAEQHLDELING